MLDTPAVWNQPAGVGRQSGDVSHPWSSPADRDQVGGQTAWARRSRARPTSKSARSRRLRPTRVGLARPASRPRPGTSLRNHRHRVSGSRTCLIVGSRADKLLGHGHGHGHDHDHGHVYDLHLSPNRWWLRRGQSQAPRLVTPGSRTLSRDQAPTPSRGSTRPCGLGTLAHHDRQPAHPVHPTRRR